MILTVTFNPAIDHTYILDEDLEDGNISRTEKSRFDAGGKGINVSSYLSSLGLDSVATGFLGGFTGKFIRSELDDQGLDYDFVEGGRTRINTTVVANSEEYKINHSGPETHEENVKKVIEKIRERNPEAIVISGSLPPGIDYTAIERIKNEVSSKVVVDLSGDVLAELNEDYFLAKPNEEELSKATGIEVNSVKSAVEASEVLLERGFQNVLASLGEKGALLSSDDQRIYAKGLDVEVVDTTGAGDAMLSATISELLEGKDKFESLKNGLAFSTIVVQTSGTQIPELEKLEEYKERAEIEKR